MGKLTRIIEVVKGAVKGEANMVHKAVDAHLAKHGKKDAAKMHAEREAEVVKDAHSVLKNTGDPKFQEKMAALTEKGAANLSQDELRELGELQKTFVVAKEMAAINKTISKANEAEGVAAGVGGFVKRHSPTALATLATLEAGKAVYDRVSPRVEEQVTGGVERRGDAGMALVAQGAKELGDCNRKAEAAAGRKLTGEEVVAECRDVIRAAAKREGEFVQDLMQTARRGTHENALNATKEQVGNAWNATKGVAEDTKTAVVNALSSGSSRDRGAEREDQERGR